MSDWVIDDHESSNTTQKLNPADWELAPEENESPTKQESYWDAVKSAPGKMLSDATQLISRGVGAIPDYWQKGKTEIPALINPFGQKSLHPLHVSGQVLAGLNEAINSIAQSPLALSRYGSNRLNLLPHSITNAIEKSTPEDTTDAINQLFGEPKYEGEAALRGTARNTLPLTGIAKIGPVLNPMNLKYENIANNVVKSRNAMREKYSGPNGLYTNLFNDARKNGLGTVNIDPKKIDINTIKEYANPKYTEALDNLMKNSDIEIAQKAQSDLKKYVNSAKNRDSIPSPEQDSLKAAKEAQAHIEDEMFKGNKKLKQEYNKITTGYGQEVIPYTTNKAINEYIRGDLLAEELVPRLGKGKFAARRGKNHPAIKFRNALKNHPYLAGSIIGSGGTISAKMLYDKMKGKESSE